MMGKFRAVFGPIPGNTKILPSQSSNPGEHYKVIPGEPEEGGPGGTKQPESIQKELNHALQKQLGANKVSVRKEVIGLVISLLTDRVLFVLGETKIMPEMREVLNVVAKILT